MNYKGNLLLVDDEANLLSSMAELLALHDYQTTIAEGGEAALDILGTQDFDLVILDLNMPRITGHDVLRHIQANQYNLNVIVVSGETSFEAVSEALKLGAYDYLRKPYVLEGLLTTIGNAISKKQLQRQNQLFQKKLSESERLHRYIVEHSPDMIYMLDEQGSFTYLNDRSRVLLGYDKNQLLGTPMSALVHEDDINQNDTLTHIDQSAGFINREMRLRCADNSIRHFDFEVLPVQLASSHGLTGLTPDNTDFKGVFGVARDITERVKAEETISYQAYHDLLTNLPNRGLFEDRMDMAIAQAKRNEQTFALMFLDLDRFKLINDTLGHTLGDMMLQAIAQRLQSCVREGDTLARFGGDEFTLLLPLIRGEEDAILVAEKIRNALKSPFSIEGHELFTSVSIGIALYPRDGTNLRELIAHADTAMYAIKQRGKNGYQLYQSELDDSSPDRIIIENDLRRAIEQNEFTLHYQPQVDVITGNMSGLEALIRWDHPKQGRLMPLDFIDIAEQSGIVVPLGKWVIEKAIQDWTIWRNQGVHIERVAVNISPLQIAQPSFADDVIDILASYSMPAKHLEIEITESLLINDTNSVIEKLRKLSDCGINIAIDDFGTGYSSLSYLQKFPLRTLKIDRAFIEEIKSKEHDSYLVNAIVSIAKGLNLELVAEGVETWAQLEYLKARGCDKVQGYLFSKAVDASEVEQLVRAENNS